MSRSAKDENGDRVPLLTNLENIKVSRLIEAHYHKVEGTAGLDGKPYWAWDDGWSAQRIIKEAGLKNLTKSRLDYIRMNVFGKQEEQRYTNIGGPFKGKKEKEISPRTSPALSAWMTWAADSIETLQKKHKADMQAVARDFGNLQEGLVAAASRAAALEARNENILRTVTNLVTASNNLMKQVSGHATMHDRLASRVEALEAAMTAPQGEVVSLRGALEGGAKVVVDHPDDGLNGTTKEG